MVWRLVTMSIVLTAGFSHLSAQARSDLTLVGFTGSALVSGLTPDPLGVQAFPIGQTPEETPGSFTTTAVLSGMFGALGFIGGAVLGVNTGEGELGNLIPGALVGGWLVGGIGGSVGSGRPAHALVGSAVGLVPGVLVLRAVERAAADGPGRNLGYLLAPLAHGLVTAAFTRIRFGDGG